MAKANQIIGQARHFHKMQVQAKLLGMKPLINQKQPNVNLFGYGGRKNFSSVSAESSSIFD